MIPEDLCPKFLKSMEKLRQITDQFVIVQFWIEIKFELINHNLPPVQRQITGGIIKVTIKVKSIQLHNYKNMSHEQGIAE